MVHQVLVPGVTLPGGTVRAIFGRWAVAAGRHPFEWSKGTSYVLLILSQNASYCTKYREKMNSASLRFGGGECNGRVRAAMLGYERVTMHDSTGGIRR